MGQIVGVNGLVADVSNENRLLVDSVSQPEDKHLNLEGRVFSLYFTVTPTGADDYFFYLKNNGTSLLDITDIRVRSSVATTLYYEHVSGTPTYVTGTDVATTSRFLGSANLPTMEAKYDTDITGLTSEGVLFFEECAAVDTRYKLSTTSNIVIPQGQAVAFRREAATGEIDCVVSLVINE
jgi:hypothetical protein